MTGILIHNGDRPDIIFQNGMFYGGLHCGDCFEIHLDHWVQVRLEYFDDWILILEGGTSPVISGVLARI